MRSPEQEAWDDGVNPVDLPYGPGNPDYENDGRIAGELIETTRRHFGIPPDAQDPAAQP